MKKEYIKIAVSTILFVLALVANFNNQIINNIMFIVSYIIIGGEIVLEAIKNVASGELFDEAFLMTVATIGAIIIGEYSEAVAVMLLYEIGEQFQDNAVEKSRKSIESLAKLRGDYANIFNSEDGTTTRVDPKTVKVGDIIVVKPGEKVPLDGKIIKGTSSIDTSALTGESVPKKVKEGDKILSGCINLNSLITVEVEKEFENSTVSKILELIENTDSKKAKSEKFITKFAKYYTPIVVILALIISIVPPLLFRQDFVEWINRAFSFLVISCPCALVISVPLSFFGGIGKASKQGILIKGSTYIDDLANAEIVVFDKTGTLTKGVFEVVKVKTIGNITEDKLLELSAYAESHSNHPIAQSIKRKYDKKINVNLIKEVEEISGLGIVARLENDEIVIGNSKILDRYNVQYEETSEAGTIVYIAVNRKYIGYIVISDIIKPDAKDAIKRLKNNKIQQTVMLSGDMENVVSRVSKDLEIDRYYSELLPHNKVEKIEELRNSKQQKQTILFVGDGINDAPVLNSADVGIAMGALGSDVAIEAADVVIMNDEPSKVDEAIEISRKTIRIVKQNIVFAILVKIIVLILGAIGVANMWEAIFADVGVSIIAILNSLRALK